MTAQELAELIEAELPDARVDVRSEDDVHFAAKVLSPAFDGKGTLERHRMVYAALGARMGGEIHALSLLTLTPAEAAARTDARG